MAGERTFTEGEAYALVEDGVKRETAALTETVGKLEAAVVTLGNEKDALELRAKAAEDEAAKAKKEHDDFVAEIETQKAAEARWADREKTITEAAPKLELTDERKARITAMADEDFDKYLDDIRQIAAAAPGGETTPPAATPPATQPATPAKPGELPRATAAFAGGGGPSDKGDTGLVKNVIGARRALGANA